MTQLPQKSQSEHIEQYGDKHYWESRYAQTSNSADSIYEWYLSFTELQPYLVPELTRLGMSSPLLVTGCGNSTLCEDLLQCGQYKVLAIIFIFALFLTCRIIYEL